MGKDKLHELRKIHGYLHDKRIELTDKIDACQVMEKGFARSFSSEEHEEEDYDVDFVVLWLDSRDPKWIEDKNRYLPADKAVNKSNSAARFRNWDIFKYWFRAVEKYAPWVRNVYLVTYGHYPAFLDLESPKLKFVKHADFMPEEYLPTFSCFPTELNLWRIEGISEHIVYFNDDMFLNGPVSKSDFFCHGLPKYSAIALPPYPNSQMTAWHHNLFNTAGIINDKFDVKKSIAEHSDKWFSHVYDPVSKRLNRRVYEDGKIIGMYFSHLGVPYRCSTMKAVWEAIPEKLDATCRNRFRTFDDVFHQIFQMWEIFSGTFEAVGPAYHGLFVNVSPSNINLVEKTMKNESCRMLCINDTEIISDKDYEELKERVTSAFEQKLSEKSSFEI